MTKNVFVNSVSLIMSAWINWIKDICVRVSPIYHIWLVRRLKKKKTINVVFFAASVSMWRYQRLYECMAQNPRFNTNIIILPASAYSESQQDADTSALMNFFNFKNTPFIIGRNANGEYFDVRGELMPDLLFYPQPYHNFYTNILSFSHFYDKLLCYIPYAFWDCKGKWSYDQPLHRLAWKLFYPTPLHKDDAVSYSFRKGKNMEIVGYPTADDFLYGKKKEVWRAQNCLKKRIIWACHFTIFTDGPVMQSNFLWMSDYMCDIACQYSDKIQFVFKPHPRLYTELCKHPDWGEAKAKEYYKLWETMDNTQIETGEFVDLFMTSDAMIHDCGSFSVEYHYSENPVMYIAKNFEEQIEDKNDFGKIAMNLHYVGKEKQDIIDFIENVVLKGDDPLKPKRQQFKQDYLLPPHGKTEAENTMDVLIRELC